MIVTGLRLPGFDASFIEALRGTRPEGFDPEIVCPIGYEFGVVGDNGSGKKTVYSDHMLGDFGDFETRRLLAIQYLSEGQQACIRTVGGPKETRFWIWGRPAVASIPGAA